MQIVYYIHIINMTSYHGGKQRIGKAIADVIKEVYDVVKQSKGFNLKGYCEPFCGMLGVYRHIPDLFSDHKPKLTYKAGDVNESVIEMWKESKKGWVPPTSCTEKVFNALKQGPNSAMRGYIGHQYSFAGQFFAGYAPKYGKTGNSSKASENIVAISSKIQHVQLRCCQYESFSNLKGYIIYCDPPYSSSNCKYFSKNGDQLNFDTERFWNWCRYMSEHNLVFVSGYEAPRDFLLVFSNNHRLSGNIRTKDINRSRTENLYFI
jgi:site-specific DNA-adenine methylase